MTADIVKLEPLTLGEAMRLDPDEILESAKGGAFVTLAVIAQYEDGTPYISGNANCGELLILLEQIKHVLVFGEAE